MNERTLSGHTTEDTAYVVEDYPYGFRLRCRIRYWLEFKPGKGFRLMSQTSNPKRGDTWNKPKGSTYSRFGGVMLLDEKGHVTWTGLSEYDDLHKLVEWRDKYAHTMPVEAQGLLKYWIGKKLAYERACQKGQVSITTTTRRLTSFGAEGWHEQTVAPTVETTVCNPHYTPEQLDEMGATLRPTAKFKVGDVVSYTNEYGVTFYGKTITEVEWAERGGSWGWFYYYTPGDSPWFSVREEQLTVQAEIDAAVVERARDTVV